MKKRSERIILGLILILGILLRIIKLESTPYPLNGDEKAFGYYAWSIANFGTDEYGNKLPLYFPSIGDYKYPVYTYLSVPIAKVIGLNEYLPRILSLISSLFLIYLIYKFVFLLFKSKNTALIAALLMAISPWSLTFSRTASESNLMTLLIFAGLYFLCKFFYDLKNKKNIIWAVCFLVLASFTYSASRIFIPLILLSLVIFFGLKKDKQKFLINTVILVFFVILEFTALRAPESRARANSISMINNNGDRKEWITNNTYILGLGQPTNPKITRIYFNKASSLIWEYAERYFSHFSPGYLFLKGDVVKLNAIDNFGNFYVIDVVFLIVGIMLLIWKIPELKFPEYFVFMGILIGPVAASGSIETPSAVRHLIGLPYLIIAISLGLSFIFKKYKKMGIFIFFIYIYLFGFLIISVFKIKPYSQPWTSDQGNQELVEKVWELKSKYKYVFMPNDPYIDFLFYLQIKPEEFLKRSAIEPEIVGKWNRVKSLDNIIFNAPENCPKIGQTGVLYICKGIEVPRAAEVIEVIRFKDNIPKYVLVEFKPKDEKQQSTIPLVSGLKYMTEGDGRYPLGVFPEKNHFYYGLFLNTTKD